MNIKEIYKEANALLEGHFLLASKKHSANYLQSAKVLEEPQRAEMLCKALAKKIQDANITVDTVCAPAIGGLIVGYELARALGARSIFVEKSDGGMVLRRGFKVAKDENILICEDIITTGGSAQKAANAIEELGANVVAFAALANRGICAHSEGSNKSESECKLSQDKPLFVLGELVFEMYEPERCPLCKEGHSKAIKPGSGTK